MKGLSKNNNSKKDLSSTASTQREMTSSPPLPPIPAQLAPQVPEHVLDNRPAENGRRPPLDPGWYAQHGEREALNNQLNEHTFAGRDASRATSAPVEKDRPSNVDMSEGGLYDLHENENERVQVFLPSRRKGDREEKVERHVSRDDMPKAEGVPRRQNEQLTIASAYSRVDSEVDLVQFNHEGHINAILEVAF